MIKFLLLLLSINVYAIDLVHPRLYFTMGYPYVNLQSNTAEYGKDYLGLSIGAIMEYQVDEVSSIDISINASYYPERESMRIAPDGKVVKGRASLLTSFYSLSYSKLLGYYKSDSIIFSVGPSIGIHTLNYDRFNVNNTDISAKNRVRIRNHGLRTSLKIKSKDLNKFFEVAYYYMLLDKYTIIDDATLDAQSVREDNTAANDSSWSIIFNLGLRIF